jgi:ureidoglycolate lyase
VSAATTILRPRPLTPAEFAPFGDVIATGDAFQLINDGTTRQFEDLARIDVECDGGRARVSIYRVVPYALPLTITMLERHPLGSQLFMPLHGEPFLIVVARAGDRVEPANVQAFLGNGRQGVNYHRGTWHHPVIALRDPSEFLVLDRTGPGGNCDEVHFADKGIELHA